MYIAETFKSVFVSEKLNFPRKYSYCQELMKKFKCHSNVCVSVKRLNFQKLEYQWFQWKYSKIRVAMEKLKVRVLMKILRYVKRQKHNFQGNIRKLKKKTLQNIV